MYLLIGLIIVVGIFVVAFLKVKKDNSKSEESSFSYETILHSKGFKIDKSVGAAYAKLYIDNENKKWAIHERNSTSEPIIFNYSDLIDFELLEDSQSKVKGGFGKALVGGVLGGTTGAIIGAAGPRSIKENVTLIEVIIHTNRLEKSQYRIKFNDGFGMTKGSSLYHNIINQAQELISSLNFISYNGEIEKIQDYEIVQNTDITSEIRKLNELKTEGIITQEEFDAKKKEILNL